MFKEFNKITTGFVIQKYIILPNGTMVCQDQQFIAGDPVDYEDMNGESITIDTTKEVYCPLEMKQPKHIPAPKDAVKFVCPACPSESIEAVMDGSHTTRVVGMFKSGGMEYGDTESNGDLDRFQCAKCGYVITINDESKGPDEQEPITDDDELVAWCKKNCDQN
jgi:predicted RNA-binding Zn-ribbon protein involved in translation (DUF1610 family)